MQQDTDANLIIIITTRTKNINKQYSWSSSTLSERKPQQEEFHSQETTNNIRMIELQAGKKEVGTTGNIQLLNYLRCWLRL